MSRVWTYVISRSLTKDELNLLFDLGNKFVQSWTAHEQQLTASFEIFNEKIIIVKVNETITGASGCSIDKLSRFIKNVEKQFNIELLDRLLVAYKNGNMVEIVHATKIKELLSKGDISENTIVYDTSVSTQNELLNWEKELKNTWLKKYIILPVN